MPPAEIVLVQIRGVWRSTVLPHNLRKEVAKVAWQVTKFVDAVGGSVRKRKKSIWFSKRTFVFLASIQKKKVCKKPFFSFSFFFFQDSSAKYQKKKTSLHEGSTRLSLLFFQRWVIETKSLALDSLSLRIVIVLRNQKKIKKKKPYTFLILNLRNIIYRSIPESVKHTQFDYSKWLPFQRCFKNLKTISLFQKSQQPPLQTINGYLMEAIEVLMPIISLECAGYTLHQFIYSAKSRRIGQINR